MPLTKNGYKYAHPDNPNKLISRQRLHQIRNQAGGRCSQCGRKYAGKWMCKKCKPRRRKAK